MEKAMFEVTRKLMESGMSEADAAVLIGRLLEEEARDYIEFSEEFDKAREKFIRAVC